MPEVPSCAQITPFTTVKPLVPPPPDTAVPFSIKSPALSKVQTLLDASVTDPPLVGVMIPIVTVVVGLDVGVVGRVGVPGVGVVGGVGVAPDTF